MLEIRRCNALIAFNSTRENTRDEGKCNTDLLDWIRASVIAFIWLNVTARSNTIHDTEMFPNSPSLRL